jgi:hypothetical protein
MNQLLGIDRVNEEFVVDYEGGRQVSKFTLHMDIPLDDDESRELRKLYEESLHTGKKMKVKAKLLDLLPAGAPTSARAVINALDDNVVRGLERVNEEMVDDYEGGRKTSKFRLHMDIALDEDEARKLKRLYTSSMTTRNKKNVKKHLLEVLGTAVPASAIRAIEALDDTLPLSGSKRKSKAKRL